MTILFTAAAILAAIVLIALLLPRKVVVTRAAEVGLAPADVIARVSSTEGFQTFNPYVSSDPALKITPFGPASGVGSGFRFEGKEGKGTQTVTAVSPNSVTHLIDLGAMGKPVQTIRAEETATGSRVTWTVTSDMGFNPIFRIFGLFMDRMLGKTYERGLSNIAALSCSSNDTPCGAPSGAPFAFARWLSSLRRAAIASSGRFRVQRVCSASAAGLGPSKPYPQEPYRPSP